MHQTWQSRSVLTKMDSTLKHYVSKTYIKSAFQNVYTKCIHRYIFVSNWQILNQTFPMCSTYYLLSSALYSTTAALHENGSLSTSFSVTVDSCTTASFQYRFFPRWYIVITRQNCRVKYRYFFSSIVSSYF